MSVEVSKQKLLRPKRAERRTDVRRVVRERFGVVIRVDDEQADNYPEEITGVVTDVGTNGLGVIIDHSVAIGAAVEIEIQAHDFKRTIHCRLVWCAELPSCHRVFKLNPNIWRAGLEFKACDESEAELIRIILSRIT